MVLLTAKDITKTMGLRTLFEGVTFGVNETDRIGVIGANGSGKSTMLKALAGLEPLDSGQLQYRNGLRVAYQAQTPVFDPEQTVIEFIFANGSEQARLVREYEKLCRRLEDDAENNELMEQFEGLSHRMDAAGVWEYETRAKDILTRLGVRDFDAQLKTLSGGYRKKLSLAQALLSDADLLILDEPTNHLDADTVGWLERYLLTFPGALLLVTHDRYFLDRVTRRIFELERGEVHVHEGTFDDFLASKAQREERMDVMETRRQNLLRKEMEWLRRGPKARGTKAKARIDNAHELMATTYRRPQETLSFHVGTRRLGKRVMEIKNLCKSFDGRPIIRDFTYSMTRGERIGIIGPNGTGKSTLANIITGRLEQDSGYLGVGKTVAFGYFDQEALDLNPQMRAIDYVKTEGGSVLPCGEDKELTAEQVMEQFLFTPNMQYTPIGKLSGGERRRLYMIRTLMRDPNFLLLDEPTNDLDISTLEALEDFLDAFKGCLITISHDRYFLDRVVDRVIAFEGDGTLKSYPGNYSVYVDLRREGDPAARAEAGAQREETARQEAERREAAKRAKPKRLSYMEQRELDALERGIPELEEEIGRLETEMSAAATDHVKLTSLANEHEKALNLLAEKMERWETLASVGMEG